MGAIAGRKIEPTNCPLCSFSSKRLTTFEEHVISTHNISIKTLWDSTFSGPVFCKCGCGSETTFSGWKNGYGQVIIGHNANLKAVYGDEKAAEIAEKRAASLRGKPGWAKGLTKHGDERVAKRAIATSIGRKAAFDSGTIQAWNVGATKETDERVKKAALVTKLGFESGGRVAWHRGKSESTDERIKIKNDDLRQAYADGTLKIWSKGLTKAQDPRISKTWQKRDPIKEYAHVRWTDDDIKEKLQNNSWLKLVSVGLYKNDRTPGLVVRCNMCDYVEKVSLLFAKNDRCPNCCPTGSHAQHDVANFVQSLGVVVGRNVKGIIGRQELDIYIPTKKLAIEYNGLYWHNVAAGKDHAYHQGKSDKCSSIGITLFHVFEDEWRDKRSIVESMIKHRLGMTSRKIAARKCSIKKLNVAERQAFFNANHIDGDTNAKLAIGLFLDDELAAAISLRVPFHKKHATSLEVARMCGKLDTNVQGSLSRLTRAAANEARTLGYKSMLTYVDARFGASGTWTSAGWIHVSDTPSRFWWTDDISRFNRFKYKADSKNGLTEEQVASSAGVVKIFGCKNLCYRFDC